MIQQTDAIYENGVLRPDQPLQLADGQRVSVTVASMPASVDDLKDIEDLLDTEFVEACRAANGAAPSLEEVRRILSAVKGPISELIVAERDER